MSIQLCQRLISLMFIFLTLVSGTLFAAPPLIETCCKLSPFSTFMLYYNLLGVSIRFPPPPLIATLEPEGAFLTTPACLSAICYFYILTNSDFKASRIFCSSVFFAFVYSNFFSRIVCRYWLFSSLRSATCWLTLSIDFSFITAWYIYESSELLRSSTYTFYL